MKKFLRALKTNVVGGTLVMVALTMPVLIGGIGLGVEAAFWFVTQGRMQDAADSGALSGARFISTDASGNPDDQVAAVFATYGFSGAAGSTITVNTPPASGPNAGDDGFVEVIIVRDYSRSFSGVFGSGAVPIAARAVARIGDDRDACVVALNPTKEKSLNLSGTAAIGAEGCDFMVHSSHAKSIEGSGSASVTGRSFYSAGGAQLGGDAELIMDGDTEYYSSNIPPDPYANAPVPPYTGCDYTNTVVSDGETINPGVYCGGFKASGANVTLNPGIYIFDRGKFELAGGSILNGTGVTLAFTSSTGSDWPAMNLSGGSGLNISAPTSGSTNGFAIYGDRDMPQGLKYVLSGSGIMDVDGIVYLPRAQLEWSGSASIASQCLRLVADRISLSGSANFGNDCDDYDVAISGGGEWGLVE